MPNALVTGVLGQDGAFAAELLLDKGYDVVGIGRASREIGRQKCRDGVDYRTIDLRDAEGLSRLVADLKPDEIYNFGGFSHVGKSFEAPLEALEVNGRAVVVLLQAVRAHSPASRLFSAASAEVFGQASGPTHEDSPLAPVSPYGAAKAYALHMARTYRRAFGVHASSGIFFNHESERRPETFVTRKITAGFARIIRGEQERLTLGNVAAQRDWGYAPDYVEAAWRMLQCDEGDDYVVATGVARSVSNFIEAAAAATGLDLTWEGEGLEAVALDQKGVVRVSIDPRFYRPVDVDAMVGDASKARRQLDWTPTVAFEEMVRRMVQADL